MAFLADIVRQKFSVGNFEQTIKVHRLKFPATIFQWIWIRRKF